MDLEKRIYKFYTKMSNTTTMEIIRKNGQYNNEEYGEFEYVKMKRAIDNFLNNKYVNGFNELQQLQLINDDNSLVLLDMLSDGEKRIFALASMLLEKENNPSIYIWDEPEIFLNPSWQREIIPFVESLIGEQSTLMIATHSLDILSTANKYDSKIFELTRNNNKSSIKETNIFDNKTLTDEFLGGYKNLEDEIGSTEKFIITEGKTDRLYLEAALEDHSVKILSADSASQIWSIRTGIFKVKPNAKIISIFDHDVTSHFNKSLKNDTERIKTIIYKGLDKDEAVERLFYPTISGLVSFKWKESNYSVLTEYDNDVLAKVDIDPNKVVDMANSKLKQNGFLESDKFSHKTKTLPSKTIICEFLIKEKLEDVKKELKPTIEVIKQFFE